MDLVKSITELASLVKELIYLNRLDEVELAELIVEEIVRDIGYYADEHLKQYKNYTINALQLSSTLDKFKSKSFNFISLLKGCPFSCKETAGNLA